MININISCSKFHGFSDIKPQKITEGLKQLTFRFIERNIIECRQDTQSLNLNTYVFKLVITSSRSTIIPFMKSDLIECTLRKI